MRTSPAEVKLMNPVPLIDRSAAGAVPAPMATGPEKPAPAGFTTACTTPSLTKATISRPSSEAPTTG
jgi:hypothetical protein